MANKFARLQNTNGWWNVEIEKLIDAGEELKGRELNTFKSTGDVEAYRIEINDWLNSSRDVISVIYVDQDVTDESCRLVNETDYKQQSRLDIIRFLEMSIDERIQGFRNLINSTP